MDNILAWNHIIKLSWEYVDFYTVQDLDFGDSPKCHDTPTADESSVEISSIRNCISVPVDSMNFPKKSKIACHGIYRD